MNPSIRIGPSRITDHAFNDAAREVRNISYLSLRLIGLVSATVSVACVKYALIDPLGDWARDSEIDNSDLSLLRSRSLAHRTGRM